MDGLTLLFDDFEKSYEKLYRVILSSQQDFVKYVLSLPLGHKNVMGIIMLIKDLCENENVCFAELYEWILQQMFCEKFFDYSYSYRFVDCLILLESDIYKILGDIVSRMDVNQPISIQIAMASMYQHHDFFEKFPQLGYEFLDRVLQCIEKDEQFVKTVHMFLKPVLKGKHYWKYRIRFLLM